MNINELKEQLQVLNLKDDKCYSLNNHYIDEGYVLRKKGPIWEIYYCEKGKKNYIKRFVSEEKACAFFLKEIGKLQISKSQASNK